MSILFKYCIIWVCICSVGYSACNARAPYFHMWSARLYSIFPHYLVNGTIFDKFLNIKCVFLFFLLRLSETFFIIRRIERDVINMYAGLHIKSRYSCQILMKLEFCRQISKNTQISNLMNICAVGAELFHAERRRDGRTDDGQTWSE